MALAETARLVTELDLVNRLTPGLAQADASLAKTGANIQATEAKAAGLSSAFGSVGVAVTAGVAAFAAFKGVEFLEGAVQAASEEEAGIKRLTAALTANLPAWQSDEAAVEAVIARREQLAFSDDDLRSSLAALVPATHDLNEALAVQSTAMDLARLKGVSLQEATTALVTIEAGRFRGLAQLGIVLKQGASQQEALAAVQKVAAGQAEAFANSTEGAAKRADIAFHNLEETIGAPLLDAFAVVEQAAADAARGIGDFVGAAEKLINEAGDLKQQAQDTGIRIIGLADAIDFVTGAFHAARDPAEKLTQAAIDTGKANEAAAAAAIAAHDSFSTYAGVLATTATAAEAANGVLNGLAQSTADAQSVAESAGPKFDNLNNDIQRFIDQTDGGVEAVGNLISAIDRIPRNIDINFQFGGAAGGTIANPNLPGGSADTNRGSTFTPGGNQAALDAANAAAKTQADLNAARQKAIDDATAERKRKNDAAVAEAARKAKQAADELAQANREKVANSYDAAKRASDRLFDSLHERHIKAIKDAENLAEKNHDAAVQQIADNLAAAKQANAAPVTAAEQAQSATEHARQLRDLQESVQAAQQALATNRDQSQVAGLQRSLRDAVEALQSFNAQDAIDKLKVAQTANDTAAEQAAKQARDKADADLEAAKLQAAASEALVNKADAKKKQDFDVALAALKKKDEGSPAQFLIDLKALETKFGIFTDQRGFTHIGDVVADAIKNTKPPDVHITLQVPRGAIQLNGRDVNNASTVGISPTQAQSTRSGQAKPKGN